MPAEGATSPAIAALVPEGDGHQFVVYGDACSGVPGAPHERTFSAVNAVLRRLRPEPDFILFTGDEIAGLTTDGPGLREQWRHFLEAEMGWLDRRKVPVFHVTGNHTAFDEESEAVFRDVLGMPGNGPPGQEGLSYAIRRGDLLLVVVHTLWSGLGGEGHVETDWLREVLRANRDARHKLVAGHHPVFSVNGFAGPYQREVGPEHSGPFWTLLAEEGVLAYVCSHILAFDVQVHRGVLQITTAGAGTAHRMPEGIEYLHAVQMALDAKGLRYQVLDLEGRPREGLAWPMALPDATTWAQLRAGPHPARVRGTPGSGRVLAFRFEGRSGPAGTARAQTLLSTWEPGSGGLAPLWIGLAGPMQRLKVVLAPEAGRSPHTWHGPAFPPGSAFAFDLVVHTGMGPGGLLVRLGEAEPWSSLTGASPWGAERLAWPECWSVGQGQRGPADRPFLGGALAVRFGEIA